MVDDRKLTVEYWPIDRILPYAANARTHPDEQVLQLIDSMSKFGFTQPCLVDANGVLIAGHGRLLAASKLGLKEAPVIRLGHLTEAQARAYRLADNRIALNSEWDEDLLKQELAALQGDFDLDMLGFDVDELEELLPPPPAATTGPQDGENEMPEPPVVPASRPGDVWQCGAHRVICGDSTSKQVVETLLAGETPHLMVTDPPYGVEYDPSWRAEVGVNKNKAKMGKVLNDDRADWRETWALFPGDVAYVWHACLFTREVLESLEAVGFEYRSMICWAKDRFTLGRGHYHWQHEPAWYVVRKGATGHWNGARDQSTVWNIKARDDSGVGHGTQKPVECMRRPMLNNSNPGDAVYDPFLGSGTSMIAAESEGRRCFGCELNPVYVDVIVKRWQDFTGQQATLVGDGRTFAEIAEERLAQADAA